MTTRLDLMNILRQPHQPRVWTTRMLARLLDSPPATTSRVISWAAEGKILKPVREGVYLNAMAFPEVKLAEASSMIRSGAIVSLQSVLGDAGVLNNPTLDVTCVLATTAPSTSGGTVKSMQGSSFFFRRISPKMLVVGELEDRFEQGVRYLRATPEKALLDWLVLGLSPHSAITMPPCYDIDIDELDRGRLERLASAMDLEDALEIFLKELDRVMVEANPYSLGVSEMGI